MKNNENKKKQDVFLQKAIREDFRVVDEIDEEAKMLVERHIEEFIGSMNMVYHEMISEFVHVDVYHVAPDEERPFHTLITHGMSDLPMNVPEEFPGWEYGELICFLPQDWDLSSEGLKQEKYYWVIENLKSIARFPHQYDTWIGWGHTIQNEEPALPFSEETKLNSSMIISSTMTPEEFDQLQIREDKTITFWSVIPLYEEELHFKLEHGTEALLEKFDDFDISEIYNVNRINTCKK